MKDVKTVTVEKVNFNAANVASKEKAAFVDEMLKGKLLSSFEAKDRKALFEKAFELCKKAAGSTSDEKTKG